MFERIATGWELARQCWQVLRQDKHLVVFPLISGVACLLVLASFALPLWQTDYLRVVFEEGERGGELGQDWLAWVILFAFYLVNYFVIVFFNSALVACAILRFKGGEPTIGDGLQAAAARTPQILAWAAVSATVGLVLRMIESRSEKAGRFAAALLGAAWTIGAYFVVPLLVVERVGPLDALKRSVAIMRKTWGEALSARFGIGIFVFLASLVGIGLLIGGVVVLGGGQTAAGIALLVAGLFWLLAVSLISATLNSILLAALYLYAAEDIVPAQFDRRLLDKAFGKKD